MFDRLQQKWKVNGIQLLLILCTFAIGGSLTGYVGRKLMNYLPIEQNWIWLIIYIIVVTILWPFAVLIVSIFFAQYRFFSGYLKKLGRRIGLGKHSTGNQQPVTGNRQPASKEQPVTSNVQHVTGNRQLATGNPPLRHIAIFASGAGSNAQKIIDHFRNSASVQIALIACNKPGAGVLNIAAKENIAVLMIEKENFFRGDHYLDVLKSHHIDLIVLAGFLWKIPPALIDAYRGHIVNIHPALLPNYGGKGMYGNFVHEAVINAKEKESGITIHYVDEHYDHGDFIFQAKCAVYENDTAESLAQRIHALEHEHYPKTIERLLSKN